MSIARHHAEWLSLVEVTGPFLSMPVLMRVFPQGLESHDSERFRLLRLAYEEWQDEQEKTRSQNPAIHAQWIKFVLRNLLELPDNCIAEGQAIPQTLQVTVAEHGELLRPNLVIQNPPGSDGSNSGKPRLLIQTYPSTQDLSKPVTGHTWKASPDTRMMELLHGTGVRLGLVTNGERWMLVDAPRNETTGFASWYAHLWLEDQITFRAFTSLLNANRFFNVPDSDTLEALLAESANNQQEVTDQLGYQVRKAVEVLVQSLDQADQDHGRQLLAEVPETELYEAALTVMMRLVFLFCAEERHLLLLGDDLYDENYAVSTLQAQLRQSADQHGEEILERRYDAWCRLLSTFRAVFGGIHHERMPLPPYGGNLFNPDRFPFLEGRKRDTTWRVSPANPLPVNNRTVLHLLDALQLLQVKVPGGGPAEARRLSFQALDIEQIGHVYEGLLDHTAKRAAEPVLGLAGPRDKEPEVPLSELERLSDKGEEALVEFLVEQTGRSDKALRKALHADPDLQDSTRLQGVCGSDNQLLKRLTPFAGLIRDDTFAYPVVIPVGSAYVTAGTDRRSSGTHYTPRILTEPIVQYTLEPLVYVGPAEGKPKEQWKLKTARELLDLKICDMACGSGAFLVQACRYMSERLLEAWEMAENASIAINPNKLHYVGITPEGTASTGKADETLIPRDADERKAYAQRLIAQRCLYGVDINPLACEMAKLSLWLLTLAKNKPFTFLDHAIRCGDSLLGIHDLRQLKTFSLDATGQQYVFGQEPLDELVSKAIELRLKIESMPSNNVEDIDAQARLMDECERRVEFLKCAADMLVASELKGGNTRDKLEHRDHAAVQIGYYLKSGKHGDFRAAATKELGRRSFHWPLEFPEIVATGARFNAFVGNPPFMKGARLATEFGDLYREYLVTHLGNDVRGVRGQTDLCAFMFLRAAQLVGRRGAVGLIATNTISQGDTRAIGLDALDATGHMIFRAVSTLKWPGEANLEISQVWLFNDPWAGPYILDGTSVTAITPYLTARQDITGNPLVLESNDQKGFKGQETGGTGFVLDTEEAHRLLGNDPNNAHVIRPFLRGEDFLDSITQSPRLFVINFRDWPLSRESAPAGYVGPVASDYPDCLSIVEHRAKGERLSMPPRNAWNIGCAKFWWRFAALRPEMQCAIRGLRRVLFAPFTAKYCVFGFVDPGWVLSAPHCVFAFDSADWFAVLQSTLHTAWAFAYGSTLESRLRYTRTSCFETFPFPKAFGALRDIGESYHSQRSLVTRERGTGLTSIYNAIHDEDDKAEDMGALRQVHKEMDKEVAAAYGWDDLDLGHGFHQTKQGLRFTISEPARREVLARLLKLNHERYAEEVALGLHDKKKAAAARTKSIAVQPAEAPDMSLFALMTYPATEADKVFCAALLAVVQQTGGVGSTGSLTALLLATHPEWCKVFLKPADRKRLDSSLKRAPAALVVRDNGSIRWKDARDHLESKNAIKVDRGSPEQVLTGTPELAGVKAMFPGPVDEIVALALTAADGIAALRKDIAKATQEQKQLVKALDDQAKSLGLSAA